MAAISNTFVLSFLVTLITISGIYEPTTSQEFEDYVKNGKAIVNFYQTLCQDSQRIAPIFDHLAQKYTNIRFLKMNVNGELNLYFQKLRRNMGVYGHPSFFVYNNGKIVKTQVVTNQVDLEMLVKELNGTKNEKETQNQAIATKPVLIPYEGVTTNKNSQTPLIRIRD